MIREDDHDDLARMWLERVTMAQDVKKHVRVARAAYRRGRRIRFMPPSDKRAVNFMKKFNQLSREIVDLQVRAFHEGWSYLGAVDPRSLPRKLPSFYKERKDAMISEYIYLLRKCFRLYLYRLIIFSSFRLYRTRRAFREGSSASAAKKRSWLAASGKMCRLQIRSEVSQTGKFISKLFEIAFIHSSKFSNKMHFLILFSFSLLSRCVQLWTRRGSLWPRSQTRRMGGAGTTGSFGVSRKNFRRKTGST